MGEADDYERYVVICSFFNVFEIEALFYDCLGSAAQREAHPSQLIDTSDKVAGRVAVVEAIRGQDKQIIVGCQVTCLTLRLRNNLPLHVDVSECSANLELTVDAIMENHAICSLNSLTFIMPVRVMLDIELLPAAVLTSECGNRVADVSDGQTAVKNHA